MSRSSRTNSISLSLYSVLKAQVSTRTRELDQPNIPWNGNVLDGSDNLRKVDVEDVLPEPRRTLHERLCPRASRNQQTTLDIFAQLRTCATDPAEVLVAVDRLLKHSSLLLELPDVLLPLAALVRVLVEELGPLRAELLALLLRLVAADVPALIEAPAAVVDERIEPPADVLVLLNVDATHTEARKEVVEGLAAREALRELAEAADGGDEVLVGGGVVDERVEGRRLGDVPGGVERAVDPLLEDVEDGGDGVVVRLVALCTVADLKDESGMNCKR